MSTPVDPIKAVFEDFSAAWKSNSGAAVAALFVEDGALVNPFGQRANGRKAVEAMYAEYFGGMLHGTSTSFTLSSVRFVGNDHALADGEQIINASDGSIVLTVHLVTLLRRESAGWRFADARPYVFTAIPG